MILTPLGHTEFLVDIKNPQDQNVRILVDTWLSDYAVGDLMERIVKVRLDPEKISTIDAIYISHAHTDHFDPYTLMKIYGDCHREGGCATKGSHTPECEHPIKSVRHMSGVRDLGQQKGVPNTDGIALGPRNDGNREPLLLLPFTLAYLVPLIREYLGDIHIEILTPKKPYLLSGIEITGYMFSQSEITNEDDVMMLAISNGDELLFAEIDTLPDDTDADVQGELYRVLTKKDYTTVCYLASRNCLDGALPLLDLSSNKRQNFIREYKSTQKEEIHFSYEKYTYEEYEEMENIYTIPGFVRGFIGQGIAYPASLSPELFSLSIFPLDEIASLHADIARGYGYDFAQKALIPGRQYRIENGTIETGRKECPIGELSLLRHSEERRIQISETLDPSYRQDDGNERIYASGPLFPRDVSGYSNGLLDEKNQILDVLNHRFLPYWSASPVAPLRDALIKNEGTYRIGFKNPLCKGGQGGFFADVSGQNPQSHTDTAGQLLYKGALEQIIFEYSMARSGFIEVPYDTQMKLDEEYWLDDVFDFLDGRQELYSNFWHRLDPKKIYRLWTCLGANFCNNDLVIIKYRLHFERAKGGETSESFFEGVKKNLIS